MANSAKLPDLPKEQDFEEYVAACYQAGGRYVEQRLIERDPVDFMEFDVVATDYSSKPPSLSLVEVKSGKWTTPGVFKIRGWMGLIRTQRAHDGTVTV